MLREKHQSLETQIMFHVSLDRIFQSHFLH